MTTPELAGVLAIAFATPLIASYLVQGIFILEYRNYGSSIGWPSAIVD